MPTVPDSNPDATLDPSSTPDSTAWKAYISERIQEAWTRNGRISHQPLKAGADGLPDTMRETAHQEVREALHQFLQSKIDGLRRVVANNAETLHRLAKGELSAQERADFDPTLEASINTECKTTPSSTHSPINQVLGFLNYVVNYAGDESHTAIEAASQFMHDVAGQETDSLAHLEAAIDYEQDMKTEPPEEAKLELSATAVYKDMMEQTRMARVALLKIIGASTLFNQRLMGIEALEVAPFDLAQLLEETAQSLLFRAHHRERMPDLTIEIDKEPDTNTEIQGDEAIVYLVFMNMIKNTIKIMQERGTPQEKQHIQINCFERDNVLFIHYEDRAGGIDVSGVIASAVRRIVELQGKGESAQKPRSFEIISQGSWKMARELTLDNIYNLVFEGYITARQGGSGLGLKEAKNILGKHGAFIQPCPTRSQGTQFLIAFPRQEMDDGTLQSIIDRTQFELDQKENENLGIVAA